MAKVRTIWMDGKRGLKPIMKIQDGFIVGSTSDNKYVMEMVGEPSFDKTIDNIFNLMYHTMAIANDITDGKKKDDIYDHVVTSFSLFVDKFHPEMKERKFEGKTDEEILQQQKDAIKRVANQQDETKMS